MTAETERPVTTERLDRAVQEIARRRELAEVATQGEWTEDWWQVRTSSETDPVVFAGDDDTGGCDVPDSRHIAANDPTHVLAVLDAATATLNRHAPEPLTGDSLWCQAHRSPSLRWPCPDALAVLDVYAPGQALTSQSWDEYAEEPTFRMYPVAPEQP